MVGGRFGEDEAAGLWKALSSSSVMTVNVIGYGSYGVGIAVMNVNKVAKGCRIEWIELLSTRPCCENIKATYN